MSETRSEEATGGIDVVTGLPLRREMLNELDMQVQANRGGFALLVVDLDELKSTNDTQGHPAGDELLMRAGNVLAGSLRTEQAGYLPERRQTDFEPDKVGLGRSVFRVGGDEFIVILPGITKQKDVDTVISRLRANLDEAHIPVSMGGRVHKPSEAGKNLIKDADRLMYVDKYARKARREQIARQAAIANYRAEVEALSTPRLLLHWAGVSLLRKAGVKRPPFL